MVFSLRREELDLQRLKGILLPLTLKTFWTILHLHLAAVNHPAVAASITIIWWIQLCLYTGGQVDFSLNEID